MRRCLLLAAVFVAGVARAQSPEADRVFRLAYDDPQAGFAEGERVLAEIGDDPGQRLHVLLSMGRAAQWMDRPRVGELADRLAREPGPRAAALAAVFRAQAAIEAGDTAEGLARIEGALPALAEGGGYWASVADLEVCDALVTAGQPESAQVPCERAADKFAASGRTLEYARAENLLLLAFASRERLDLAETHGRLAREAFARAGSDGGVAMMDDNLADLALRQNRPAEALAASTRALAYEERHGKRVHAISSRNNRARALAALGRPGEALAVVDGALADARALDAERLVGDLLETRLDLLAALGRAPAAAQVARELVAFTRAQAAHDASAQSARLQSRLEAVGQRQRIEALERDARLRQLETEGVERARALADARADRWRIALFALVALVLLGAWYVRNLRRLNRQLSEHETLRLDLLARAAHELRNPLSALSGLLELAQQRMQDVAGRRLLVSARAAAAAVVQTAQEHLDAVELARERVDLHPAPFDLAALLGEIRDLHALDAAGKGLALRLECAPDLPARLVGDALRIRQILWNLVGNAVKFTTAGEVRIVARRANGPGVVVSVLDSGPGIDVSERERVFQPFRRGRSAHVRAHGVGLGLTIARQLAERMDGRLVLKPDEGAGGACFELTLPLARPVDTEHVAAEVPASGRVGRVLIVEDDPFMSELLEAQVQSLGAHADVSGTLADALARWRALLPDLLLVDFHLGPSLGTDLIAAIRKAEAADGSLRAPRIVVVSASQARPPGTLAPGQQPDAWMRKPVTVEELEHELRHALSRFDGEAVPVPVPS